MSLLQIWYDWNNYLSQFSTRICKISEYHHFRFDVSSPGNVFVKEHALASEVLITLIKKDVIVDKSEMPEIIIPPGISLDRQKYLFEKIRPYCSSEAAAEATCPKPITSVESQSQLKVHIVSSSKSSRKCSHCRQPGHTKTVKGIVTCPVLLEED